MERDLEAIWHPFSQRELDPTPIAFVRGKGAYLFTEKGDSYIDAIASWWVNLHGHCHPKITAAIAEQSERLEQVIFTDFTHPGAIRLAEKLLTILPKGFSKVFYTDNGSTAVECALKMAIQYWTNQQIQRPTLVSFKGGYHGDTFGAMSVAGKNVFNRPFWPYLFEVVTIDPPFPGEEHLSIQQMKKALSNNSVALFLYEPLVQGAGGMRIYSKKGLQALLELCREAGVILIADEVMTGFGRTGPLFVSENFKIPPDIICLSKGITGGFLPLGATICNEDIYRAFSSDKREHALLHGHSYTANPIACAAAIASFDLLIQEKCTQQREMIAHSHHQFCEKWQGHFSLKRMEYIGTILVLEFLDKEGYYSKMRRLLLNHFLADRIIIRPLGNVLYLLPPYCIEKEELKTIYQSIETLLEDPPWL